MKRILIFGDSVTYGAWDIEGGWVDKLKCDFHKLTVNPSVSGKYQLFNLGIGGNTTRDLLNRIESEISARISSGWENVIVIANGLNDSRDNAQGNIEVPIEEFKTNLEKIISIAKNYTSDILLLSLTNVAQPELRFKDYIYYKDRIQVFNKTIEDISKEMKINLVKFESFNDQNKIDSFLYTDGLHPNNKGHDEMYKEVKNELLKLLGL